MYEYLATLRLLNGTDGACTIAVGPRRRVLLKDRVVHRDGRHDLRRDEVKRVLRPLAGVWSPPDNGMRGRFPGSHPVKSFLEFKLEAKRLLAAAGMLRAKGED